MLTANTSEYDIGYRVMLLHPNTRWHHVPLELMSQLHFGRDPPRFSSLAGKRIRFARGFIIQDPKTGPRLERLKGDILRFDEIGHVVKADLRLRMQEVSSKVIQLFGSAGTRPLKQSTVINAAAKFQLAGLTWTIEEPLAEMLRSMMLGDFPAPSILRDG